MIAPMSARIEMVGGVVAVIEAEAITLCPSVSLSG